MKLRVFIAFIVIAMMLSATASATASAPVCVATSTFCYEPSARSLIDNIKAISKPPIAVPEWLR